MAWGALALMALAIAGCAGGARADMAAATPDAAADVAGAGQWRALVTPADRLRIRGIAAGWDAALADARARGFGAELAAEGALLQPDAALPNPFLPPGDYRCRMIKLGDQAGVLGFVAYGWFACQIAPEQGLTSLVKTTGSQRPVGLIFPDTLRRQIFLGTLVLADEARPLDYGVDRMRDMAGVVERIGDDRWRLVLPQPAYESLMDVMEIVPAD